MAVDTTLPHQRQEPFHFRNHPFPFPLVGFRRRPMAGPPLLFALARKREGQIQFAPDAFSEFGGVFSRGFVPNPFDYA